MINFMKDLLVHVLKIYLIYGLYSIASLAYVDSGICCVDSVSRRADTDNMLHPFPSKHTAILLATVQLYNCTINMFTNFNTYHKELEMNTLCAIDTV